MTFVVENSHAFEVENEVRKESSSAEKYRGWNIAELVRGS